MPTIKFKLNGQPVSVEADGTRDLLWVLRTELGLTGTKYGCGKALCGTCAVLVDNRPVRSCMLRLSRVAGKEVTTIEALEQDGRLHPIQQAFIDHDALQCGFCTPGMIMTALGFLLRTPEPTREQIVDAMNRNLCRCGAHPRIVNAIEAAAAAMRKQEVAS